MSQISPERRSPWTRRHFLRAAGALTAGMSLTRMSQAMMRTDNKPTADLSIGILLGTFGRPTLEASLDASKACELTVFQLNLGSAGLPMLPDQIPSEVVTRIRGAIDSRKMTLASLEGTFNMSHPDAEQRRTGLRGLRTLAEACAPLGTSKIHICTGTRDPDNMWRRHPDNDSADAWRDMVACGRGGTAMAEQATVVLAFEPEVNNIVDSAKKARRLMDEVGSAHLKVTIDGANIFHAGELVRMSEILDEAFELIGKDIALAHAKDLSHDGDAGHEAAGHGKLDYLRYLTLLCKYDFHGPLLLHGLSESQVPECVTFLRNTLARVVPDEKKRP
jgi:sugar phosphate isomerase/epimerase